MFLGNVRDLCARSANLIRAVFQSALGGNQSGVHFGPYFADFRALDVGDALDQIIDSVEQFVEWRSDGIFHAARTIAGSRCPQGSTHRRLSLLVKRLCDAALLVCKECAKQSAGT